MLKTRRWISYNWKHLVFVFLLFLFSSWAGRGFFRYLFFSTHDAAFNIARSFDAIQTLKERHFPLRWAGSLNYGCGVPIYNFFYPLFYYLVALLHFLGLSVIGGVKILFFSSFFLSTLFFYLWIWQETKDEVVAFGAAFLYLFAPYRFLLIFVRGSPEFLTYMLLPLVLFFYSLYLEGVAKEKANLAFLFLASFSQALFLLSHNIAAMFGMGIIFFYLVIKLIRLRKKINWRTVLSVFWGVVSGLGLASFFIGPALLEKKYVRLGVRNVVDFRNHFPTLRQLIRSPWGYGYSVSGPDDGMSFQLGYAQWLVLGLVGVYLLVRLWQRKRPQLFLKREYALVSYFLATLLTIFLALPWSLFIWEKFGLLQQVQFPWRLLGAAVFLISVCWALFLQRVRFSKGFFFALLLVSAIAAYGNRNHLFPQPLSPSETHAYVYFDQLHPLRHSSTTIGDEVLSVDSSASCSFETLLATNLDGGESVEYRLVERGNTYGKVKLFLPVTLSKGLRLGLEYFPEIYHFAVNGKEEIPYFSCQGKVCLTTEFFHPEANFLEWRIHQSPIERKFNYLSLAFLLVWILILAKDFGNWSWKRLRGMAIFLLLGCAFFYFRFYRLPWRLIFNWDQERDAVVIKEMLERRQPVLIGPRVLGPEGFFLPPWYYYLIAPFYWLFSFNPELALPAVIIFYNALFLLVSFWVLGRIWNKKVAAGFCLVWSILPLTISADTIVWNPLLIPLLVLLFIYLTYQTLRKPCWTNIFLSGLIFSLGVSSHFQFILLLPGWIYVVWLKRETWQKQSRYWYLWGLLGLLLPAFPLVLFDLRHQFLNLRLWTKFLFAGSSAKQPQLVFWPVWQNWSQMFLPFGNKVVSGLTLFLAPFIWALTLMKKSQREARLMWRFFLASLFSFPFFWVLWGQRPSEYYFNYLAVVIVISGVCWWFKAWGEVKNGRKKAILLFLSVALLISLACQSKDLLKVNPMGLRYKARTVRFLKEVTRGKEETFSLSFSVPFGEEAGFSYLIKQGGLKPSRDYSKPLFRIIIPPNEESQFIFGGIGVHIPIGWIDDYWL